MLPTENTSDNRRPEPDPGSGSQPRDRRITLRTADDLAAIPGNVVFGLQMMAFWAGGVFLASIAAEQAHWVLGLVGFLLISNLAFQFYLGGTARMLAANLQNEERSGSRAAWAFVGKKWLGLSLGSGLVLVLVAASLLAVVLTSRSISDASPTVGSLLIVPLWGFFLFGVALLWNSQLLPVVMGVEDCSAFQAVLHLLNTSPLWLVETFITVIQFTLPKVLGSLIPTGVALVLTFISTRGERMIANGLSPESDSLASVSYMAIVAIWLAYSASTMAIAFAVQYYNRSR